MALNKITVDSISANAVTNVGIENGTIVTVDLADNSVTGPKIVDGTITQIKLDPAIDLGVNPLLFAGQ